MFKPVLAGMISYRSWMKIDLDISDFPKDNSLTTIHHTTFTEIDPAWLPDKFRLIMKGRRKLSAWNTVADRITSIELHGGVRFGDIATFANCESLYIWQLGFGEILDLNLFPSLRTLMCKFNHNGSFNIFGDVSKLTEVIIDSNGPEALLAVATDMDVSFGGTFKGSNRVETLFADRDVVFDKTCPNVKHLRIVVTRRDMLPQLVQYHQLKTLQITNIRLDTLMHIPPLLNLEQLTIRADIWAPPQTLPRWLCQAKKLNKFSINNTIQNYEILFYLFAVTELTVCKFICDELDKSISDLWHPVLIPCKNCRCLSCP